MIGCAAAVAAGFSHADTATVQPSAESSMACVVEPPADMRPVVPSAAAHATVRVALSFSRADAPPEVTVFYTDADPALTGSVVRYARLYRLPCLSTGANPVDAVQEFDFVTAGHRQIWHPLRDRSDRAEAVRCVVVASSSETLRDFNDHVGSKMDLHGNVLTRQRFFSMDQPPQVDILYDGGDPALARAAVKSAQRNRMPCLPHDAPAFVFKQTFVYSIGALPPLQFKDVNLREFLGLVEHLDTFAIRFDFSTMGCPFAVKLDVTQPYVENSVTEVGQSDINRVEFVEWLKTVHLKLRAETRSQLIGTSMTINVPCAKVDLTSS